MVNFNSDEDISASQLEPKIGYNIPTLPPPHASAVELWWALTSLQLNYAKCVAELKLVKKEKAELHSKLREKKKKSKKSASEAISGIPSMEIRVVVKKFCVMSELFLKTSTSIWSFVKPMVNRANPDSGTHYASFASYEEGHAAEFFSALPKEQHDDVSGNDTYFQMAFSEILSFRNPASLSSDCVVTATVGKIWGVEKVTPGAIAFAAVMVWYVLAPDTTIKY
ncbi:hypothetical protein BDN71DRAFT_1426750 [Pleurotus eryngii]|uniref:Uncharacterized protein n=1 Tax=Pleurotus eryngii TaxID=5323 RepID=A0A9P6A724_PLEER|nr:hypothetical protein BDN71DRAFT_1426750 [Pleurotus eryngii]